MKHKVTFIADTENLETYSELHLKEADVEYIPLRKRSDQVSYCNSDLVVLDCGLDFETGLARLKEIKQSCPGVLLLFLTAAGSERIAVQAFRAGARDYFRKPVNLFEFQNAIEKLLSLKGSPQEKRSRLTYSKTDSSKVFDSTTTEKPLNLLRAVRYIEENLSSPISLHDLAKESSLSKFHFCRAFHKYFGLSPMTYLTARRVQRAKELLSRDDMTVSTVAYELGYDSPGSLIRNFRKSTGFTPTRYRNHVRQKSAKR